MEITDKTTVKDFFTAFVPQTFGEQIRNNPLEGMGGTEFTLQFNVTGGGGGVYAVVVKDGKDFTVVPGGISSPLIAIEISEAHWRETVTGKTAGVMDMFMSPQRASRKYFDILGGMRGTLVISLTKDDGSPFAAKITFNGAAAPTTTIKMKASDYALMSQGKIKGPDAFMTGKMRIEGDMGFAMKLGQFM